jgi:hypothetical protein
MKSTNVPYATDAGGAPLLQPTVALRNDTVPLPVATYDRPLSYTRLLSRHSRSVTDGDTPYRSR